MVIHTTPCVRIDYGKGSEILLISWLKKPGNEEFKDAYTAALQLVTSAYPTTLFCTDLSLSGALDYDQENWLFQEYYSQVNKMIKAEIYAAVVFSEAHFKALITNYKVVELEKDHPFMHFNYFTQTEEAFHWLRSMKKGQDALLLSNSSS